MSGPEVQTNAGDDGSRAVMGWRGFGWRVLIAMLVIGLFTGTSVALIDRGFTQRVEKIKRVPGLRVAPSPPGGANYLIIGSDSRDFATDPADEAAYGPADGKRSDTIMVAHVEPGSQKTFVVSFPRDLMIDSANGGKEQINATYAENGAQGVIDALHENFNIDINHYLEIDFKSFQDIVDTIGAVRIYFPDQVRDQLSGLQPLQFGPGCYYLNGGQALAYVRSRHLEKYLGDNMWVPADSNSDLDRIGRQQYFIKKLAGLAIEKSLNDPFLGVDLADQIVTKDLTADPNLNRDDVNALISAFKTVDVNNPNSIKFETLPVETYPPDPNRVQASYPDADAVVAALGTFGDNKPPPASVLPAQVTVKVLDGTGTNIGQGVVSKLAEQGFKASGGTATTKLAQTEIRYGYDSANQAKALVSYFPDAKLVADPTITSGVQLVLGATFSGDITVPSTTTTAPPSTVAGSPTTTTPPSTTKPTATSSAPIPSDACPQ
jgi:LCP family protein required for cell wall assembly